MPQTYPSPVVDQLPPLGANWRASTTFADNLRGNLQGEACPSLLSLLGLLGGWPCVLPRPDVCRILCLAFHESRIILNPVIPLRTQVFQVWHGSGRRLGPFYQQWCKKGPGAPDLQCLSCQPVECMGLKGCNFQCLFPWWLMALILVAMHMLIFSSMSYLFKSWSNF